MVYSLAWLPDALLGAGLKVSPVDGWEIRGRGDSRRQRHRTGGETARAAAADEHRGRIFGDFAKAPG